ncbi:MAG: FtsQ-type POTRA domain-containing protein [Pseudomonadota bacterium]
MSVFLDRQNVQRKRQWSRRLRQIESMLLSMLVMVAGLAAIYGLYKLIFLGSVFKVERIVVEGNWNYITADEVAFGSGIRKGDNLFWISVSDIHKRLKEKPWIKEVAVRRQLPDTLCIYVKEFRPAAIMYSNQFYHVDDEGSIIKIVEVAENKDLPVLNGIMIDENGKVVKAHLPRLKEMLSIVTLFDTSRFGRKEGIAEINYDEIKGYSIITRRNPMQILIGKKDLAERIDQIDRMSNAMIKDRAPIQYMVANEGRRIIVRYRPS